MKYDTLKLKNTGKNISLNPEILDVLMDEISSCDFIVFMKLINYVDDNNVICYKNSPMNTKGISEKISKSYEMLRKIFPNLIKADVLRKSILNIDGYRKYDRVFIINPWIYSKTNILNISLLELFSQSKWKTLLYPEPTDRKSYEYALWEHDVKERDNNQCVICGSRLDLEVHHISPYCSDFENRLNIKNGITLCKHHHNSKMKGSFHNTYGTVNNTEHQLMEYIKQNKK